MEILKKVIASKREINIMIIKKNVFTEFLMSFFLYNEILSTKILSDCSLVIFSIFSPNKISLTLTPNISPNVISNDISGVPTPLSHLEIALSVTHNLSAYCF